VVEVAVNWGREGMGARLDSKEAPAAIKLATEVGRTLDWR
jgi:hypothetical protein